MCFLVSLCLGGFVFLEGFPNSVLDCRQIASEIPGTSREGTAIYSSTNRRQPQTRVRITGNYTSHQSTSYANARIRLDYCIHLVVNTHLTVNVCGHSGGLSWLLLNNILDFCAIFWTSKSLSIFRTRFQRISSRWVVSRWASSNSLQNPLRSLSLMSAVWSSS